MTKLAITGLALAVALGLARSAAAADEKVDVSGTWEVEIEINGQTGMPEFTLKQEGEKLTGKYKGQFGEADVTGTVKGADVEFSFDLQEGAKVTYKGKVDKDTIEGEANYADQATGKFKAKKKADK